MSFVLPSLSESILNRVYLNSRKLDESDYNLTLIVASFPPEKRCVPRVSHVTELIAPDPLGKSTCSLCSHEPPDVPVPSGPADSFSVGYVSINVEHIVCSCWFIVC